MHLKSRDFQFVHQSTSAWSHVQVNQSEAYTLDSLACGTCVQVTAIGLYSILSQHNL